MPKHGKEEMPDPEAVREIMDVVSEKVPGLLREVSDVLYGPDQARKFGKAAALFYRELKKTGMSDEEIFELTRQYMNSLNVGSMFEGFAREHKEEGKKNGKKRKKKE